MPLIHLRQRLALRFLQDQLNRILDLGDGRHARRRDEGLCIVALRRPPCGRRLQDQDRVRRVLLPHLVFSVAVAEQRVPGCGEGRGRGGDGESKVGWG